MHSHGSWFLQDTVLHSLAPGLLAGSIPDVLIMAWKFKVPLQALSTFSDMVPMGLWGFTFKHLLKSGQQLLGTVTG